MSVRYPTEDIWQLTQSDRHTSMFGQKTSTMFNIVSLDKTLKVLILEADKLNSNGKIKKEGKLAKHY